MNPRPPILNYSTSRAEPFSIEPLGDRIALRYPPESQLARIAWMWIISIFGTIATIAAAWGIWAGPQYGWLSIAGLLLIWWGLVRCLRDELRRLRAARRSDPSLIVYLTSPALRQNPAPPNSAELEPCLPVIEIRVAPGPYLPSLRRAPALQLIVEWGDTADLLYARPEPELLDIAQRLRTALKLPNTVRRSHE